MDRRTISTLTFALTISLVFAAQQTAQAQPTIRSYTSPATKGNSSQKSPLSLTVFKDIGKTGNIRVFGVFDLAIQKFGITGKSFGIEFTLPQVRISPSMAEPTSQQNSFHYTTPYGPPTFSQWSR